MTVKKTNILILISTIISLLFAFDPLSLKLEAVIGIGMYKVIEYGIVVIIGIVMLKKSNEDIAEFLPYNVKPKIETILWVIVLFVLIYPINAVLAYIGGEYLGDLLDAVKDVTAQDTSPKSIWRELFDNALVPAVFEEVFYRGIFYQGYKKNKGARTAIIATSLLFGMFHMVPQQFLYTVPAGFVLAVLRELTGSMWPGTLLHFLNNGFGCFEEKLWKAAPVLNHFNFDNSTNATITLVAAAVSVVLIILVLRRISKIEGREEDYKTFFKEDRDRASEEKLLTAPLVISLVLQGATMVVASVIGFVYQSIK